MSDLEPLGNRPASICAPFGCLRCLFRGEPEDDRTKHPLWTVGDGAKLTGLAGGHNRAHHKVFGYCICGIYMWVYGISENRGDPELFQCIKMMDHEILGRSV